MWPPQYSGLDSGAFHCNNFNWPFPLQSRQFINRSVKCKPKTSNVTTYRLIGFNWKHFTTENRYSACVCITTANSVGICMSHIPIDDIWTQWTTTPYGWPTRGNITTALLPLHQETSRRVWQFHGQLAPHRFPYLHGDWRRRPTDDGRHYDERGEIRK